MGARNRPRFRGESGAAAAELAILGTLMAPLLVAAILVEELWTARLKLQEATRFVAWELTDFALSDYSGAGHAALFDQALGTVEEEAKARWGDGDLDGATGHGVPTGLPTRRGFLTIQGPTDLSVDRSVPGGVDADAQMLDFGSARARGNQGSVDFAGGADDLLFGRFGFNKLGLAAIRLMGSIRIVGAYNPRFSDGGLKSVSATIAKGQLSFSSAPIQLLVDDWHLADGAEVIRFSTPPSGSKADLAYVSQVGRMAFVGLPHNALDPAETWVSRLTKLCPVDPPLDPHRLVSRRYRTDPRSGQISLDVDGGQVRHHTTEIRTDVSYSASEYAKTLKKLRGGYMGCAPGTARAPREGPGYPCDYP